MSTNYIDIKKLCTLSRLEIDESEIQKTSDKIKETILFFNKLDELELNDNEQEMSFNDMKKEIKIDDLREDVTTSKSSNVDGRDGKETSFKFLNRKNGYVIGPRI